MTNVFRYIGDAAGHGENGECQNCGRNDVVVYYHLGEVVDPELSSDPEWTSDDYVQDVCTDCILAGRVNKLNWEDIQESVDKLASDPVAAMKAWHCFPTVAYFAQHDDWPMCCGDWCEFIGVPATREEAAALPSRDTYWVDAPAEWDLPYSPGDVESLREVSRFRCLACKKNYFTWQCT